jgi:predicted transcriptional regulator/transcriptional regulator with XRE-family HTH domain
MPRQAMLGNKLRRLRHRQGLTQVAMAAQLGISPSYLNLIEHNQRALNRPLLLKLADSFDVDLKSFSGNEEARLLADVAELFGDPLFRDIEIGEGELSEIVGAAPGVCQALLVLYRGYRALQDQISGLSERLADDPFLAESSHQLLTLLTSIRSFAEILHDNADLAETRRKKFVRIMLEESDKLTGLVNELFDFITGEGLQGLRGAETPADEVSDLLRARSNHFPELEEAAETLREELELHLPNSAETLATRLIGRHGVEVQYREANGAGEAELGFDETRRRLVLPRSLPAASTAFRIARQIGLMSQEPLLDAQLAEAQLSVPAAAIYRELLASYLAAALLMPYAPFRDSARELRHDIDLLAQRFGASFEQVCQRLSSLHRPGAEGVPFHFLKVDIAGNIAKRFGGSGLRIPRFGGLCPRWNVHAAFMRPDQTDRQVMRMGDGTTYFSIAKAVIKAGGGFGAPPSYQAICLGCEVSFARQLVYTDGMELDSPDTAVPVGVHCRLCEREDCAQRAFPSLVR